MAPTLPSNQWMGLVLAGFCWLISYACTPLRGAGMAGRIVAGTCFLLSLGYVIVMALKFGQQPSPATFRGGRSDSSLAKALVLFATWGLPAGIYAASGVWMKWRKQDKAHRMAQGELEGATEAVAQNRDGAW